MAPIAVPPATSSAEPTRDHLASPKFSGLPSRAQAMAKCKTSSTQGPEMLQARDTELGRQPQNNGIAASNKTGTASYDQALRPQIHYTPSSGFMNDPNGLVVSGKPGNETIHLYYQYNPTDIKAGNQHWGHATSKSFESHEWHNHLPAIAPSGPNEGVFSGSAVIDRNNTTGFFDDSTEPEDRIMAIYTCHTPEEERQCIAYSTDGGYTYTKYEQNPVLTHKGHFQTQFRDPKVFWDAPRNQWVMAVAHTQEYQVGFYTSPDLKEWTSASNFTKGGILGFQYECPALFQAPIVGGPKDGQKAWVMLLSINPGAPQGGSFNQYFIGDWDGKTFTTNDNAARIADFGKDWYAAQTWDNTGDKTYVIGWASNWQYTQTVPTYPWRSATSLVREITVKWAGVNPLADDYVMAMNPVDTSSIVSKEIRSGKGKANETVQLEGNGAFEINATLTLSADAYKNATDDTFVDMRIYAGNDKKQYLRVGMYGGEQGGIYIDRRKAGTKWADDNVWFTDRFSAHPEPILEEGKDRETSNKTYKLRLIVDRSISELYANEGVSVATVLHYWDDGAMPSSLELKSGDGNIVVESLSVKALESTWKKQEKK